jgi:hypothetical protein
MWLEWSLATQWPLTEDLVLSDRDQDSAEVLRWLRGEPSVLSLQATTTDEVVAFFHATLGELPADMSAAYRTRGVVATPAAGGWALANAPAPLILLLTEAEPGTARSLASRGHLTSADIARFETAAYAVLGSADPRFDMDPSERWMAAVKGIHRDYSGMLRHGVGQVVILLALWGGRVRTVPDAHRRVDAIISKVLGKADDRRWWSLSRDFRLLAEASPDAFLNAVEESLDQRMTTVEVVPAFEEIEHRHAGSRSLRAGRSPWSGRRPWRPCRWRCFRDRRRRSRH